MKCLVIKSAGIAYFPIPKCACSSIKIVFAEWEGLKIPAKHIHAAFTPEHCSEDDGLIPFIVVRDPLDRLASCWREKIAGHTNGNMHGGFYRWPDLFRPQMPFNEFVVAACSIPDDKADAHFASQSRFIPKTLRGMFIAKFETLQKDFDHLCKMIGREPVQLPVLNQSKGMGMVVYDNRTLAIALARYADDRSRFGY